MKKVYILEASQGEWSDRREWIVGVYVSLEALLTDPMNKRFNLMKQVSRYDGLEYYTGEELPGEYQDPIYYNVTIHDVIGG